MSHFVLDSWFVSSVVVIDVVINVFTAVALCSPPDATSFDALAVRRQWFMYPQFKDIGASVDAVMMTVESVFSSARAHPSWSGAS